MKKNSALLQRSWQWQPKNSFHNTFWPLRGLNISTQDSNQCLETFFSSPFLCLWWLWCVKVGSRTHRHSLALLMIFRARPLSIIQSINHGPATAPSLLSSVQFSLNSNLLIGLLWDEEMFLWGSSNADRRLPSSTIQPWLSLYWPIRVLNCQFLANEGPAKLKTGMLMLDTRVWFSSSQFFRVFYRFPLLSRHDFIMHLYIYPAFFHNPHFPTSLSCYARLTKPKTHLN